MAATSTPDGTPTAQSQADGEAGRGAAGMARFARSAGARWHAGNAGVSVRLSRAEPQPNVGCTAQCEQPRRAVGWELTGGGHTALAALVAAPHGDTAVSLDSQWQQMRASWMGWEVPPGCCTQLMKYSFPLLQLSVHTAETRHLCSENGASLSAQREPCRQKRHEP